MAETKQFLCLRCQEISDVDPENLPTDGCPACRHNGIPANLTDDLVTVDITWHELRVLVMWAEWHASRQDDEDTRYSMQRAVVGISDRLHRQHLDKPALTFTGEIAALSNMEGVSDVEVHGVNLLPPPDPDGDE